MQRDMDFRRTVPQGIGSCFGVNIEPSVSNFLTIIIERCREERELTLDVRLRVEHLLQKFSMQ